MNESTIYWQILSILSIISIMRIMSILCIPIICRVERIHKIITVLQLRYYVNPRIMRFIITILQRFRILSRKIIVKKRADFAITAIALQNMINMHSHYFAKNRILFSAVKQFRRWYSKKLISCGNQAECEGGKSANWTRLV